MSEAIDCKQVHSANADFCHCAMSMGDDGGAPLVGPVDRRWTAIRTGDVTAVARAMCGAAGGSGRMTVGTLAADGTMQAGYAADNFSIYVSLRDGETSRIRSALLLSTDQPLTVLNLIAGPQNCAWEVWNGAEWRAVSPGLATLRDAARTDNRYHYRILIDASEVRGIAMTAYDSFSAVAYRAPVSVRKETMSLGSNAGFQIALVRSMRDCGFPDGVVLRIGRGGEELYRDEILSNTLCVRRRGASLHAAAAATPTGGQLDIEVTAIAGSRFHLVFQTMPAADPLPTITRELGRIYPDPAWARDLEAADAAASRLWTIAVTSVVLSLMVVAAGMTIATGGLFAIAVSIFGYFGITFTNAVIYTFLALVVEEAILFVAFLAFRGDVPPRIQTIADRAARDDVRYDQMCYLTAHNAFSYRTLCGPVSAQQSVPIGEQLRSGVDALMFDLHYYSRKVSLTESKPGIFLCHEDCAKWIQLFVTPLEGPKLLSEELAEVVAVLREDRRRIVTIIFESRIWNVDPVPLMRQALSDSGADTYAFYADRPNYVDRKNPAGPAWNVAQQGWPTRKWMIDNNFRLVFFSDRAGEYRRPPAAHVNDGMPYQWDYMVETVYGDESMNLSATPRNREGSRPLTERFSPVTGGGQPQLPMLLLMNYFPTFAIGSLREELFKLHNSRDRLVAKTNAVTAAAGRPPNFIALDFFHYGYESGPTQACATANREWMKQWPT